VWFAQALSLTACSVSGGDDAQQWVAARTSVVLPAEAMSLPSIVDTPPAAYTAKAVVDPFSPSRIVQTRSAISSVQDAASGRVHFADATLEGLRVVGILEAEGKYVALVEGSSGFANVKVGDRLGNQQLDVVEISKKGVRMRNADGSESWMPINRRSH
jgi:Tfp pilus assembly protein PilP